MAMRLPCPGTQCNYVTEEVDIQAALALLTMHKEIDHPGNSPATPQSSSRKPEKFPRPNITIDTTAEAWQEFYTSWLQYKDEYGLTGQAITRQLYACRTMELTTTTSLLRTTGGAHITLSGTQMLDKMKILAVRY